MRRIALAIAVLGGASGAAAAEGLSQTCSRGADSRVVEVLTPGVVGRACDLKVTRDDGAFVSTPYHANNSVDFCARRAAEMIAGLSAEGYVCAATQASAAAAPAAAPDEARAAAADAPQADEMAAAGAPVAAPAADAAPASSQSAGPAETLEEQYAALTAAADPPAAEAGAIAPMQAMPAPPLPAPGPAPVLEQPQAAAPSPQHASAADAVPPAPRAANAGPVALAPQDASALAGVAGGRPSRGRLIGAAPEETPLDRAVAAEADLVEERLAPQRAPAVVAAAPGRASPLSGAASAPAAAGPEAGLPRAAEDVIRSVLAARAAAWNEGDLDAFLNLYWKDQGLRLVAGAIVANGWKEAFRFYRERYADAAAMGRLSLEGLDIDMVTPEVATVYGRYRRQAATGVDSGAFTLVMRRLEGLWRIVSDHTVPDASPAN